jgi:hypothetical protein
VHQALVCLVTALWILACGGGGGGTASSPPPAPTPDDFATWATTFPGKHPDPYFKLPKAQFDQMVQQLKADQPTLSQSAFLARWRKIIGSLGDEHSWFDYPELTALTLPVKTWHFPDGIAVVNADASNADLVGCRLESVAGVRAADLLEALRPYVAYSVEPAFQRIAGDYLGKVMAIYQATGLLPQAVRYTCTFTRADGSSLSRDLDLRSGFTPTYSSVLVRDQDPASYYFMREFPEQGVVYLRYRLCTEMSSRPLGTFGNEVIAALGHANTSKLVLDLRGNPGGNSALLDPFLNWLKTSPFNAPDRFLVLVDAGVFSSAFLNAGTCKFTLSSTLIGETVGQALWQYGNVATFSLPSGRVANYSTALYKVGPGTPQDPFHAPFEPDIKILETLQDFRAGRDPVLDEAVK